MLESVLRKAKKIIPKPVFNFFRPAYHWLLALSAAAVYGFPSRNLKVVGITGTSGKTTVAEMLFKIFSEAGFKVAVSDGLYFRILEKSEPNLLKMTMPGRFSVQKFLRKARDAGCEYVFLEVSSEGIKQFRHKFIKFYAAIFTNLSEEHLESHGGFENYRAAKGELFKVTPITILNGEDANIEYFKNISPGEKIIFTKSDFPYDISLKMAGDFNKINAATAAVFAKHEKISEDVIKDALEKMLPVPGRMEYVETGKSFKVLVDYAFLPQTLSKVYEAAGGKNLICVLGAAGGGRDKWKRPVLGDIAAEYCKKVFVTNEDPYDDDPLKIINEVAGVHNFEKILDRREAIRTALMSAESGDTVVVTGKGAEPWIMGPDGSKIPWDDRKIIREELKNLQK